MVTAFAPVNIAWIKYMGKNQGKPSNSSFSMTLDSFGTHTRIERVSEKGELEFDFEGSPYVPPKEGIEKVSRFLNRTDEFLDILNHYKFSVEPPRGRYRIHTSNNVPAGTGIATSASGFAALTLAWLATLAGPRYREWIRIYESDPDAAQFAAAVSRLGSGSACRSFHGPFVEWSVDQTVVPFKDTRLQFVDFILLFETSPKRIPSSEAHERVKTSTLFRDRKGQTQDRIENVKSLLRSGDLSGLAQVVRQEAVDMHALFSSSIPPFWYLTPESEFWISGAWVHDSKVRYPLITADAGANIHVFVSEDQTDALRSFLDEMHPRVSYLIAGSGGGARYDG